MNWVERWDRQQEMYVPHREDRFNVMFEVVERECPSSNSLTVLDLGCGPGAIGTRLLDRFALATYVGLDVDPVLLHLAGEVGLPYGDRFRVASADLALDGWSDGLELHHFDAVTSSTALHWLTRPQLEALASQVRQLLRPGGVFVDCDNLGFTSARLQRIASAVDAEHVAKAEASGTESWDAWWGAARQDAVLGPLCEQRDIRFPPSESGESPPPAYGEYHDVFTTAGFDDVDTVWQRFDDRVMVAFAPHDHP